MSRAFDFRGLRHYGEARPLFSVSGHVYEEEPPDAFDDIQESIGGL